MAAPEIFIGGGL